MFAVHSCEWTEGEKLPNKVWGFIRVRWQTKRFLSGVFGAARSAARRSLYTQEIVQKEKTSENLQYSAHSNSFVDSS